MKVGILGGTFDPVHFGHLRIAEEAQQRLNLDIILYIPAGQPWIKTNRNITPGVHRIKMLELAITHMFPFQISTCEIEHKGPSYSIDTMTIISEQIGGEGELFFILGWDSLIDMPRWKKPDELIKICYLVALTRANVCRPDLQILEKAIPGIANRTIILDMPPIDISSSDIRNRSAAGLSLKGLVPDKVAEYIVAHSLYRNNQ